MSAPREPRWEFGRRLIGWRRPAVVAQDVRDEMALHIELRVRELRARGRSDQDARVQAFREIGDATAVVPRATRLTHVGDTRRRRSQWRDELWQDVKSAWRSSRRAPGFTALIVLTIALGLGANAAIFGVVNVAVLAPLPFDPDNTLVRIREFRKAPDGSPLHADASRRTADAVAARRDLFSSSVAVSGSGRSMARDGGAVRVAGMRVGPGFTQVVGTMPVLGRTFSSSEEQAGEAAGVALISHRFWQTMFAGEPAAVGGTMLLDGRPYVVIGVLPKNFRVPYETDVWFPSHFEPDQRSIFLLARLAPGVTHAQARLALEPVAVELNRLYPNTLRGLGITVVEARDYFVGDQDQIALVLMAAVAVLLLIGCTNVALLLTTKFAARQVEVAMRAALGCSKTRQVRQFVTEGMLLFLVGGALGLGMATVLKDGLVVLLPDAIATQVGFDGIPLDWRLVGFSASLSMIAGVTFGLLAAMRTSAANLQAVMKGGGRSVARSSSQGLLGALVVAEVALAVVLLFGAGVMVQSFDRLRHQDRGYDTTGVMTLRVDLTSPRYASADARRLIVEQLLTRVQQGPSVTTASITTVNPVCCGNWSIRVVPGGAEPLTQADIPSLQHFIVSPGYFETLQWPVVEGRTFTTDDGAGREPVVIVERATATRFWPGESAIGKRIQRWSSDGQYPWLTVVGVVETAVEEGEYPESWYLPHAQHADGPSANTIHLLVRGAEDAGLVRDVRKIVADLDPALAVYEVNTLEGQLAENRQQDRLGAWASGSFAVGGLLLAALGLYGVLSFVVAGDRVEIAVRRALGASRQDVVLLILRRGLRLLSLGLLVGAGGAWASARVLPRFIESAQPNLSLIGWAAAVLVGAAVLAMIAPIRRALRLDPIDAMRA